MIGCDENGTIGQTGGEKTHTLIVDELPVHSHGSVYSHNANGTKITTGRATPAKGYDQMNIYAMNGVNFKIQMDNLAAYCTNEPYVAPTTDLPPINVDTPDLPETIYTFENGIPEDFTTDSATVVEKTVNGKPVNMLAAAGTTVIPVTLRTKGAPSKSTA